MLRPSSNVNRTKTDKLRTLEAAMAIRAAKQENDKMFIKYNKVRKALHLVKQQILEKYGSRGKSAAFKAVASYRK